MRIVLASRNDGKLREMHALLSTLGCRLESQADHDVPSPPEDGATFLENALIKARTVADATGLPALADDSGLVVPALDGAPGIHSARYASDDSDNSPQQSRDAANNAKLIRMLQGVEDRSAYFYCALVFLRHANDPTPLVATGAWHGHIIDVPRGAAGFGYDPHFLVARREQTSAELPRLEKNQLSHRGQAMANLAQQLQRELPGPNTDRSR